MTDEVEDSFLVWSWSMSPQQVPVDFKGGEDDLDWARRWEAFSVYRDAPGCRGTPTQCPSSDWAQIRSWWVVVPFFEHREASSTYDYSVAYVDSYLESTDGAATVTWAQQGFKSNNASAAFLQVSPGSDSSGSCTSTTVVVGFNYGLASGSVERTLDRCETWDVNGTTSQRGWFTLTYDAPGDGTHANRALAQAVTYRYPEGTSSAPVIGHGVAKGCDAPWGFTCAW